jgi:hypothetical protein
MAHPEIQIVPVLVASISAHFQSVISFARKFPWTVVGKYNFFPSSGKKLHVLQQRSAPSLARKRRSNRARVRPPLTPCHKMSQKASPPKPIIG